VSDTTDDAIKKPKLTNKKHSS
jgi:hypothetical protein